MNTFLKQYKIEIGESSANAFHAFISQWTICTQRFSIFRCIYLPMHSFVITNVFRLLLYLIPCGCHSLQAPMVYLCLLPVCFSEWRVRHYWCGADFPSRVYSRKGSANHSSKPKAQKNRLVFLLRFCQSPPSSRFSSVFVFIHLQQVFKSKHKSVSLYIPIQKILKTGK